MVPVDGAEFPRLVSVGEFGAVQVGLGPCAVPREETVTGAAELGPEERTGGGGGGMERVRRRQSCIIRGNKQTNNQDVSKNISVSYARVCMFSTCPHVG